MLNEDILLESFKQMSLNDIKNLCKTDKKMMNFCKNNKHIIFKNIVYVLTFTEFQVGNPEESIVLKTNVFKNISDAIKYMDLQYEKKKEEQIIDYSINSQKFSKTISQDTAKDTDFIYKWKIESKKIS
jgi:hypothetical protein